MKSWTKSAVRLARRVGRLARRSARIRPSANIKTAPSASARQQSSATGHDSEQSPPRKRARRETLAVEDGFKEF
jgi:hypothetical protein